MNTHYSRAVTPIPDDAVRPVGVGMVIDLGRRGGRLRVLAGRVWVTSLGDADDHVLAAGESMRVPAARTLVETWGAGDPALIGWHAGTVGQRLAAQLRRRASRWPGAFGRIGRLAMQATVSPLLQNGDRAAARPAGRLADGGWTRERS